MSSPVPSNKLYIIGAIERAIARLEAEVVASLQGGNYDGDFAEGDAKALREALSLTERAIVAIHTETTNHDAMHGAAEAMRKAASELYASCTVNSGEWPHYHADERAEYMRLHELAAELGHQAAFSRLRGDVETQAARYRYLRERDLATIAQGGIFAGMTPKNVVLNGDDLDCEVDKARGAGPEPASTHEPCYWLIVYPDKRDMMATLPAALDLGPGEYLLYARRGRP